jgi:hypothetical protein
MATVYVIRQLIYPNNCASSTVGYNNVFESHLLISFPNKNPLTLLAELVRDWTNESADFKHKARISGWRIQNNPEPELANIMWENARQGAPKFQAVLRFKSVFLQRILIPVI